MHRILERQIKHYLGDRTADLSELHPLFEVISKTYADCDAERLLLDRSPTLSSKESQETNSRLREAKEALEQKIAEQAESSEKYETLVNNLSVGVYRNTPGPEGHFLEANPAIVTMFEADSKEAFLKHRVSDLYQDPVGRSLFVAKLMKYGAVHNEELNLVTFKGKHLIVSVSAVVKKDKNEAVYFDGVIEDITERKKTEALLALEHEQLETKVVERTRELGERVAELEDIRRGMNNLLQDFIAEQKALAEAKAKDEAILESLGEGLITIDNERKIVIVNKLAASMLGYSTAELIGRPLTTLRLEDDQGKQIALEDRPTSQAIAVDALVKAEYFYVRKDKTRFPVAITATTVMLGAHPRGAIFVFRDITKEKEIEKLRIDFLSLASHQLRTPLSGTKWLIDTIKRGILGSLNVKQREYIDHLYQINERMIKLVAEMLNVLTLERGMGMAKMQKLSVARICEYLFTTMGPMSRTKHMTLKNTFKARAPLFVYSNPQLLQNILGNFVSNAISYSPIGEEVVVGVKETPTAVVFSVKDKGIGIPKEEQQQIFERFYRASNGKAFKPDGTGLGLYAAQLFARQIGGTVSFRSTEHKGATFYLHIPKKIPTRARMNHTKNMQPS